MVVILSVYSIIPAIVFALIKFGRHPDYRPFFILVFLNGIVDISTKLINQAYPGYNNLWLLNIFILVQFLLILYQLYYWKFLPWKSKTGIGAVISISALWIFETWQNHLNLALDKYSLIFSAFLIVIFITVFINRLVFEKSTFILKNPRFIISIGILIYFTIIIFVYSFYEPKSHSSHFSNLLWSLHNTFNIFTNIIYVVGIICIRKK